jgi:hypothetical protein
MLRKDIQGVNILLPIAEHIRAEKEALIKEEAIKTQKQEIDMESINNQP